MSAPGTPPRSGAFLAAMGLSGAFALLVVIDQSFWWRTSEEFSFGWLTPLFVGFVLYDRWKRIGEAWQGCEPDGEGAPCGRGLDLLAGIVLLAGIGLFVLGADYRSGAGATFPGSLAMSLGLACIWLPVMVLAAPRPRGGQAHPNLPRLRLAALFLFPALVWLLSAPNLSAIDARLTAFLLQRVVTVVNFGFNALGFPIEQQGNVLVLPDGGRVGVEEACSGIRSLKACLFAGSFLGAVMLDRFWKKVTLVVAAMLFAFAMNLVRSLFLTAWAYRNGAGSIEGRVHDTTGYAILGITVLGLMCLVPLLSGRFSLGTAEDLSIEDEGQ
jgi:exosortase/archaeosortase family protein